MSLPMAHFSFTIGFVTTATARADVAFRDDELRKRHRNEAPREKHAACSMTDDDGFMTTYSRTQLAVTS
jgi:hypothetical protein